MTSRLAIPLMLLCLPAVTIGCGSDDDAPPADPTAAIRGEWRGPTETETLNQLQYDGEPVRLTWRPFVRITDKTISFGRRLEDSTPSRNIVESLSRSLGRPMNLPPEGAVQYGDTLEYEPLETEPGRVSIKVHLGSDETDILSIETGDDTLTVRGTTYRPGG